MKITEDMIKTFNAQMETEGSIIRVRYIEDINPHCEIILSSFKYVDTFIINPTSEFYDILDRFFQSYNIKLSYNNIKSTFLSKSGWNM